MELIVFWIGFSALVGWFASSRGRSGWLAFLLALLLSPLLVFLGYAIAGRSEAGERKRIEREERLRAEVRDESAAASRAAPKVGPSALDRVDEARRRRGELERDAISPQRKAEIEAEERYRATVRAQIEREVAATAPADPPSRRLAGAATEPADPPSRLLAGAADDAPPAPRPAMIPESDDAIPPEAPKGVGVGEVPAVIEYVDANGAFSRRRITITSVGGGMVRAYCHERRAPRLFKAARITQFIEPDGECVEPAEWWARAGLEPSAPPRFEGVDDTETRVASQLAALVVAARANGRFDDAELDAIMAFALAERRRAALPVDDATMAALRARVRRMRPRRAGLATIMQTAARVDAAGVSRFLAAMQSVVSADGVVDAAERALVDEVAGWLSARSARDAGVPSAISAPAAPAEANAAPEVRAKRFQN